MKLIPTHRSLVLASLVEAMPPDLTMAITMVEQIMVTTVEIPITVEIMEAMQKHLWLRLHSPMLRKVPCSGRLATV